LKKFFFFLVNCFVIVHPYGTFYFVLKVYKSRRAGALKSKAFTFLCRRAKELRDVMLAEMIYRAAPDNSAEEWEANCLCASFR